MDHGPAKWALRKQTSLKEPGEREEANPWEICRKARMAHSKPEMMQVKKVKG